MTPHERTIPRGLEPLLIILFVLAGGTTLIDGQAEAQELAQARLTAERPLPVVDAAYGQTRIEEQNEQYDVLLLVSRNDRSLQCAVLDTDRQVVWRGKALSPTVVLSPYTPRLALIGQKDEEGFYPIDAKPEPQDITVQDLSGNVVFRISGTGPVARLQFSRQGLLAFLTPDELRVYDASGNLLWTRTGRFSDLRFWNDGQTLSVWEPEMSTGFNRAAILGSQTGALIRELRYRPGEMRVLEVRSGGGEALMAESRGGPRWDVVLYELGTWKVKGRLAGLDASPLSAAWGGEEYALLLWAPQTRRAVRAGERLVGLWRPADRSFRTRSLGVTGGSPAKDRVEFDGTSGKYRARVGSRAAEFLSSK